MAYLAGVDVGNNTTEVALAETDGKGNTRFLSSAMVRTVGIKGTLRNAMGIIEALDQALKPAGLRRDQLDVVLLNEATPVIGDIAMETITETVITESAMIGHNPSTPGGHGTWTRPHNRLARTRRNRSEPSAVDRNCSRGNWSSRMPRRR